MATFGILFLLFRMKKFKDGFIFWNCVFLMGIGRLFLDILREDTIHYLFGFGLKLGQWYSLVMAIVAGYVLLKYYRGDLKKIFM